MSGSPDRLEAPGAGLADGPRRVGHRQRRPRPDDLRRAQAADRDEEALAPRVALVGHLGGVDARQPAVASRRPAHAVELDEVRRLPVRRAVGLDPQQLAAGPWPVQRAVAVRPVEARAVGLGHRGRDRLVVDERAVRVDARRQHEGHEQDAGDGRARPDHRVAPDAVDAQVGDEQRREDEADEHRRAALQRDRRHADEHADDDRGGERPAGARVTARQAGEHRGQRDEQVPDEDERVVRPGLRTPVRDAHRRERPDALVEAGHEIAPAARLDEREGHAGQEQADEHEHEGDAGGRAPSAGGARAGCTSAGRSRPRWRRAGTRSSARRAPGRAA